MDKIVGQAQAANSLCPQNINQDADANIPVPKNGAVQPDLLSVAEWEAKFAALRREAGAFEVFPGKTKAPLASKRFSFSALTKSVVLEEKAEVKFKAFHRPAPPATNSPGRAVPPPPQAPTATNDDREKRLEQKQRLRIAELETLLEVQRARIADLEASHRSVDAVAAVVATAATTATTDTLVATEQPRVQQDEPKLGLLAQATTVGHLVQRGHIAAANVAQAPSPCEDAPKLDLLAQATTVAHLVQRGHIAATNVVQATERSRYHKARMFRIFDEELDKFALQQQYIFKVGDTITVATKFPRRRKEGGGVPKRGESYHPGEEWRVTRIRDDNLGAWIQRIVVNTNARLESQPSGDQEEYIDFERDLRYFGSQVWTEKGCAKYAKNLEGIEAGAPCTDEHLTKLVLEEQLATANADGKSFGSTMSRSVTGTCSEAGDPFDDHCSIAGGSSIAEEEDTLGDGIDEIIKPKPSEKKVKIKRKDLGKAFRLKGQLELSGCIESSASRAFHLLSEFEKYSNAVRRVKEAKSFFLFSAPFEKAGAQIQQMKAKILGETEGAYVFDPDTDIEIFGRGKFIDYENRGFSCLQVWMDFLLLCQEIKQGGGVGEVHVMIPSMPGKVGGRFDVLDIDRKLKGHAQHGEVRVAFAAGFVSEETGLYFHEYEHAD